MDAHKDLVIEGYEKDEGYMNLDRDKIHMHNQQTTTPSVKQNNYGGSN